MSKIPHAKDVISVDIENLKVLARKMCAYIEDAIEQLSPIDTQNDDQRQIMFGNKVSLLEALKTLSDITIKLGAATPESMVEREVSAENYTLTAEDVALVENFLHRVQPQT